MTGWGFFFLLVGVIFVTTQLFRVLAYIEQPRSHRRCRVR